MENTGFIIIPRQLFSSRLWQEEQQFNMQTAWLDLLTHAHYGAKQSFMRVGGQRVCVGRGQLAFSLRFLAERWGWSLSRVRCLLTRLERAGEIGVETTRRFTRITFTNFAERYQHCFDAPHQMPKQRSRTTMQTPQEGTKKSTSRNTPKAQRKNDSKQLKTTEVKPNTQTPENTAENTAESTLHGTKKNEKKKERKKEERNFSFFRKKERTTHEEKNFFSFLSFHKPPTAERVADYCREAGLTLVRPEHFVNYYQARGWLMGLRPMRSWKAAARLWNAREETFISQNKNSHEHDYNPVSHGGGAETTDALLATNFSQPTANGCFDAANGSFATATDALRTATAAAQADGRSALLRTWSLAGLAH